MPISDWSSDVCSSALAPTARPSGAKPSCATAHDRCRDESGTVWHSRAASATGAGASPPSENRRMTADPAAPCRPGGGVANPADAFTVWERAEMAAFRTLDQVTVAGRRLLARLALTDLGRQSCRERGCKKV